MVFAFYPCLYAQQGLEQAVAALLKDPDLKHASVGICIMDAETGKVLVAHEAERSLVPASTLKVVTTAAAMALLKPNYRWKTHLQYSGTITADGTLNGNLYLTGTGDPTLGGIHIEKNLGLDPLLERLTTEVQNAGIKSVNGFIVGDGTLFTGPPVSDVWSWEDLGNYYAAGSWGLNIHENQYYCYLGDRSKEGNIASIESIWPNVPNLHLQSEVVVAAPGTGDNCYIFGAPGQTQRIARGTIPAGKGNFRVKGSFPDPPLAAAYLLMAALERKGIATLHQTTTENARIEIGLPQEQRKNIYTHLSPPLHEVITECNYASNNLYAETLVRTIGLEVKGKATAKAGLKAIGEWWESNTGEEGGVHLSDGSGISPVNVVTAGAMTRLLTAIHQDPVMASMYINTLPVGGEDGTLRKLFKNTPAEGRIKAKSGNIRRVKCYVGYAVKPDGKHLAFSVLVNQYEGKGREMTQALEKLMIALCK